MFAKWHLKDSGAWGGKMLLSDQTETWTSGVKHQVNAIGVGGASIVSGVRLGSRQPSTERSPSGRQGPRNFRSLSVNTKPGLWRTSVKHLLAHHSSSWGVIELMVMSSWGGMYTDWGSTRSGNTPPPCEASLFYFVTGMKGQPCSSAERWTGWVTGSWDERGGFTGDPLQGVCVPEKRPEPFPSCFLWQLIGEWEFGEALSHLNIYFIFPFPVPFVQEFIKWVNSALQRLLLNSFSCESSLQEAEAHIILAERKINKKVRRG